MRETSPPAPLLGGEGGVGAPATRAHRGGSLPRPLPWEGRLDGAASRAQEGGGGGGGGAGRWVGVGGGGCGQVGGSPHPRPLSRGERGAWAGHLRGHDRGSGGVAGIRARLEAASCLSAQMTSSGSSGSSMASWSGATAA